MVANMKLLVQEYLETNSLARLEEEYGVYTSAKPGDSVFSVNYNQITSKVNPLTNQCRGLILSTTGTPLTEEQVKGHEPVGITLIQARSFDRFFNYGDPNAASIDFYSPNTTFFEKLDGSLILVWYNTITKEWCVASRGMPFADLPITGWEDYTFSSLFKKALKDTIGLSFEEFTKTLQIGFTYVFELTTPVNLVVVNYTDYRVHLLGVRSVVTGKEEDVIKYGAHLCPVPVCPYYRFSSLDEVLKFVGSKDPTKQEGVVIMDNNFNRLKIKSPPYVAYNKLRSAMANSPRAIMEIILLEKLDDLLPLMDPYLKEKALTMQEGLRRLISSTDHIYAEIAAESSTRKDFAIGVQKREAWMPPLIDRWAGKVANCAEWIKKQSHRDSFLDYLVSRCK